MPEVQVLLYSLEERQAGSSVQDIGVQSCLLAMSYWGHYDVYRLEKPALAALSR